MAGACTGAYLRTGQGRGRWFVPVSGVILLAVSLFSILPETAGERGWLRAGLLFGAGYAVLYVVDRYVHPVCPSCSHSHSELDGFSAPLILATSIHAFIDGWGMTVAQNAGAGSMRTTIPIAVLLHKIPEGLALGVMLRASHKSRGAAAGWGAGAEFSTAVGAMAALSLTPGYWAGDLLAVAGGTFVYLGFHAVHGALGWRRQTPKDNGLPYG